MTTYELDLKYKFEQGIEKGVEYGIQRGIEIGIEQGIGQGEQGKEDRVILMLLSKGFSPKQLAEMLEIPLEKIEAIIKKHAADEAGTAT